MLVVQIHAFVTQRLLSVCHEHLNTVAMIGVSDQPCWLAEACTFFSFSNATSVSRMYYSGMKIVQYCEYLGMWVCLLTTAYIAVH